MSLPSVARRLLSMQSVREFWKTSAQKSAKINLEELEDRLTPAPLASFDAGTGILTISVKAGTAANTQLELSANGANLKVTSDVKFDATSSLGANANDFTQASVALVVVDGTNNAGKFLNLKANAGLEAVTTLKTIHYDGTDVSDTVDFSKNSNANLYNAINTKDSDAAGNVISIGTAGTYKFAFSDVAAGSKTTITPDATNNKAALYFKAVTTGVQANLASSAGGLLANYTNHQIFLAAGKDAKNIIAVYGTAKGDLLTGNDQPNQLVGFDGDDTVIGGAGNDQMSASRDFSPAYAGKNVSGIAVSDKTTIIDVTKFPAVATGFAALNNTTTGGKVASALYTAFGFFNFGEGTAGLAGAPTADGLLADFKTANAIDSPASSDILIGGEGDDGLYGFNGVAMNADGGKGNDVFSSNIKGVASVYLGGDGDDTLIGAVGFTINGGAGLDDLSFAVADATVLQTLQSNAVGGLGNDKISAGFRNVNVDAGQDQDTVAIANDAANVLIYNSSTLFSPDSPLASLTKVQKALRPI